MGCEFDGIGCAPAFSGFLTPVGAVAGLLALVEPGLGFAARLALSLESGTDAADPAAAAEIDGFTFNALFSGGLASALGTLLDAIFDGDAAASA